jgi:glucosamine 6-phosphate synthetase-like amidotransferase/phosphosugar isomerase protein
MCGVFGIVALRNIDIKRILLRQILKNLTQSSQSRGRDATGYAFSSKNETGVFKHNVKAHDFIKLANYKNVVRTELASKNFYSVIGHTRAQTKGSPTDPNNNHPIKVGNIIGVHNGVIMNDDSLFESLTKNTRGQVSRVAQVDSEVIFSLINYYSTKNKFPTDSKGIKLIGHITDPTSQAIIRTVGMLKGTFVCAVLDIQNPKATWIFRGSGQLSIRYFIKCSTKN